MEETCNSSSADGGGEIVGQKVVLRVYDISRGMARTMSPIILGKQIDGIWHTGVLVYGLEYFYGGGIVSGPPEEVESTYGMTPVNMIDLGYTYIQQPAFHRYLESIRDRFTMSRYDLLHWNCNNFTDDISKFLLAGTGIPSYIIDLPQEALRTRLGSIVLPIMQAAQAGMQEQMSSSGELSLWTPGVPSTGQQQQQSTAQNTTTTNTRATTPPRSSSSAVTTTTSEGQQQHNTSTTPLPLFSAQLDILFLSAGDRAFDCLQVLIKIIDNLLKSSNCQEFEKYRKLKYSSTVLFDKLLKYSGAVDVLQQLGFQKQQETNKTDNNDNNNVDVSVANSNTESADGCDEVNSTLVLVYSENSLSVRTIDGCSTGEQKLKICKHLILDKIKKEEIKQKQKQFEETKYKTQLDVLQQMGFTDQQMSLRALSAASGSLETAIDMIVRQQQN
eukprot:GHVS01056311.1.p1 GENE.GHVS01056311.1~~GHVS01056311.1.p1  ORF type:complete len:444 (+),score=90.90 GHVS01056311.1:46-1377(+)